MKYAYYPGCSLTASAQEFDASTRAVMERLSVELTEVPDWTCCGASAVEPISRVLANALPARNMALVERELPGTDMLIPCSACYLNHLHVLERAWKDTRARSETEEVLAVEGLSYAGSTRPRHLLDVLANDVGADRVAQAVTRSLAGLSAAPYYGCQALRPYPIFDDPERPASMEPILQALGAEVHAWDVGGRCCGASLMTTHKDTALAQVRTILEAARGADCVVTVCPMCQMNLEAFQADAGTGERLSILYLPQLMGLAMGLAEGDVQLGKNMEVTGPFLAKIREAAHV